MTRDELLDKLLALGNESNTELSHLAADEALLEYINDDNISFAFMRLDRWYS